MTDSVSPTRDLLIKAIDLSGKSQKTIAAEAGFPKPNMITMMKQGLTKIPIDRIPALARACGVAPELFVRTALMEYHPRL